MQNVVLGHDTPVEDVPVEAGLVGARHDGPGGPVPLLGQGAVLVLAHRHAQRGGGAAHRSQVARPGEGRTRDDGPRRAVPLLNERVVLIVHDLVADAHAEGRAGAGDAVEGAVGHRRRVRGGGPGRRRDGGRHRDGRRCRASGRSTEQQPGAHERTSQDRSRNADGRFHVYPSDSGRRWRSRSCGDPTAALCQKAEYFVVHAGRVGFVGALGFRGPRRGIYSKRSGSLREISSQSGWNENQPAACPAELSRV